MDTQLSLPSTVPFNPAPLIVQPDVKDPLKAIFQDTYISPNVKGGNSKFGYIPRKNHREIFIYSFSQFKKKLTVQELMSVMSQLPKPKRNYKRSPGETRRDGFIEKIQDLEMAAMGKRIIAICKWAFSLPPPLDKIHVCSRDELKSILATV